MHRRGPAGVLGFLTDPLTGTVCVHVPHSATASRPVRRRRPGPGRYKRSLPPAPPRPGLHTIAVDGKALRGSRTATTTYVTLLAAMDHTGTVLAQR